MLKFPTFPLFMISRSFNFDLICCEKRKSDKTAEIIMGTAHDNILDFPFIFRQLLDNFCWKLLHWTKTWSEANEWANNWWELLDPMIAKLRPAGEIGLPYSFE